MNIIVFYVFLVVFIFTGQNILGCLPPATPPPTTTTTTGPADPNPAPECENIKWVTRSEWNAREPKKPLTPNTNFKYLVVHHTSNIGTCNSPAECKIKARKIQDLHMDDKGYDDVAYNFFIDPFGSVLVGRGFDVEGGHTYRYNCDAYGVNFMGYFRRKNPTILAIEAFNNLAICLHKKHLRTDYKLVGHDQTKPSDCVSSAKYFCDWFGNECCTVCPGEVLAETIKSWPQYATIEGRDKSMKCAEWTILDETNFRTETQREEDIGSDDIESTLTMEAFKVCNLDEIDGLNWDEVEKCEYKFCEMLTITCPTKTDFESFDANGDGILTIEEYHSSSI